MTHVCGFPSAESCPLPEPCELHWLRGRVRERVCGCACADCRCGAELIDALRERVRELEAAIAHLPDLARELTALELALNDVPHVTKKQTHWAGGQAFVAKLCPICRARRALSGMAEEAQQ